MRVEKLNSASQNYRRIYQSELQVAAQLNGTELSEFFYVSSINSPELMKKGSDSYRIIQDHLGSPVLVINTADGTIESQAQYNEWGRVVEETNTGFIPFGFAGGLRDLDSDLVRFGARDYNPSTGRFMSSDPIGFAGGDTNLYRYVNNNPVNFTDPKGTISPASVTACFVAFAAGEVFDLTSNIREQIRLQDEFEAKINALDEEKKSCSNDADRLKKEQKKQKLLDEFQRRSLGNIAGVFTPGTGGKVALGFCLLSLATF